MSSKFILSSDDVQSALAPLMPGYVSPSEGAVEQQVEEESDFSLSGAAGAGVDQLQFMAYNALRAFADEFDVGVLRTVADKGIEVNKQELSEYSRIGYDDIENLSDLNKWWLDNLIINAGSFAPVVAAGMVAAPFGGLAFAGATLLPSAILGTGESYAKQLEAGGNLDSKIAMITGMTVGALDVLTPKKILNAFGIGKGFNNYLTNQLASRGALSNRFHAGVKGMLREGSTEVLQEALMTASKNYVNEQDLTDFSKEEVNELIEAFLSGGSVGATFSAALGEASPEEKAVALAKKNASINLKDTLGSETARIIEEINSLKQNEEFARKGPRGIGSFLNKEGKNRKSELKKELKQLIKDTKSKDKAIFKAKTVEEIDSLFAEPIEEDVAIEAPLEEGKTLAEIMAADPRESAIERQQQPDVIPPEGTQIGTAPTQSEIEQRLKDEAATRADQGMQDPSVIEDTRAEFPMGEDPSVLEDARPQGPFPRTREAYRKAVAERANRGSAQEERSSNPVISSAVPSDNVLTDGEVLILRQDIEEAKYSKASRELEDIAMQAESDAFEQAEADGMDYPEALAAGNEARERVLQSGGSRRKRVFPNPEARRKAQEESAKVRQEREAKLNFEAQRRIDEQKKFEKEQAGELKEQAIEMAGETYDAFFYGQISAQEFSSRRQREIAEIKDGIGGTAAVNAYRKAVPLEKANAILKERGLPTLTAKGEKPTQADTTPPVQKAPPKGGVGSSGQPTDREGKPVDPKADTTPTQADVTPPVDEAILEDTDTAKRDKGEAEKGAPKEEEAKPDDTTTEDSKGAGEQEKGAPKDAKQDDKTTRTRSASADDEAETTRKKEDKGATARTDQATTTTDKDTKVSDAISDFEVADAADTAAQGQAGASATVSGETADISTADITTTAASDPTTTPIDTDTIEVAPAEPVRLAYEETTVNSQDVPVRIYKDPENPEINIVESEGVILKRLKDRKKAVTYANNLTRTAVEMRGPKAKAAPKVRPEGKVYKGPEGVLTPGVYKFMSSNKPFKDTLGSMRLKQAKKFGVDTDVVTTEEQLYDEIITIIDKMKPVEAPSANIAEEVQKKAEEIVPEAPLEKIARKQTERRVMENAVMVQEDLTPEEIASIQEAEQNRIREAQSSGLMEDIDADIEAQIAAEEAASQADRLRLKLERESEQVSFETIDNMELADFLQLANSRRKPGWSKKQLVEIANNIEANDPTVTFNTKKNRADLAVDLIGWKEGSGSTVDTDVLDPDFVDNVNDDGDFYTAPSDDFDPSSGFDNKAVETSSVKPSNEEVLNIERSLDNNLSAMFSRSKAKELKNIKFINFITSSEAKRLGIEDSAIASYGSGDVKVYFVPERIAAYAKSQNKDVDKLTRSLIMHEVGVHAGKNIFSGQEFDLVMDQVVKLYDQKDPEFVNAFNVVAKAYPDLQLFERRFNEEVLAHVIESKAYNLETINKSLFDKLKTAFQKFFEKLFYTVSGDETRVDNLTPDVTADDMFNLISGYSMRNVYSYALKRHGDSKNFSKVRDRNRNNFVKDSVVKSPMFHAGHYNFSAPVLDKTELGLHVGTEKAALERVFGDRQKLKKGYINIQNPFEFNDAGFFGSPKAFQVELGKRAPLVSDEKDLKEYRELFSIAAGWEIAISKIKEPSPNAPLLDIHLERVKYAQDMDKAQRGFMEDIRNALISFGYDSIAYKNTQEDVGSISYILLKDNQFKDVDSLMFRSGTNVFMDKRAIEESPEKAVEQSRKIESIAGPQVTNTRKAQGKMFGVLKTMQRAIEPLMTVQGYSELETARMLAKGEVSKAHNTGRVLFDTLYQANKKEQREILKYFETKDASPDNLPERKVSVAMQPTVARGTRSDARTAERVSIKDSVIQAKKQIEKLGQDLVDMGLITQEQYNELKGSYLPRTYLEYLGKDRLGIGLGTSKLNYTKARTSTDTFLRDVMDGRIKDPGFLAARYISMAGSDIATIKYLDFIAADTGQNGWVLPNQIVNFEGMKGTVGFWNERLDGIRRNAAQMESLNPSQAKEMNAFASKLQRAIDAVGTIPAAQGYKRIPDSARYGAMRGLYVKKEIANDIMSQESLYTNNEFLNSVLNVSSKATKVFKYTKVPMNIPTQARNVISNIVLMDTSGTNFFKIPGLLNRAIQDIVSNGKYMELARKYGIESTTFASEELVTMDKELQKIKSQDKSWGGLWARSQVFFNDYLDVGGRAYQKTEVMFKIAKMIDLMENHGKSEAEAAKLANEALLDYSNVSQGVRVIRSMPLGSPFITFNLKAGAQMIRNIRNHPIAVAKYAAIPYIVSQMLLENNDDIEEEDIPAMQKLVADYMEGNMTTMILPWKDEQGRLRVFDMGYFLPWGAHLSMAKNLMEGEFGEAAKTPGFFGGPFELVAGMKTNTDPFTGQSIWSEADPPMQQYQDILGFLVSYATPPMIMPRNKSGDVIGNGGQIVKTLMAAGWMDGNTDADGLPKNTVGSSILSWMGINTAALTAETAGRKVYFKGKDVDKIMQRLIKLIDDPNVKEDQRERLIEEYRMHQANAIEKYREYADAYRQVEDVL
jgi:hypothetical protein